MSRLKKARVIAIAGGSASGKSTFAMTLAKLLSDELFRASTVVFQMDDYYKDKPKRPTFRFSLSGEELWDYDNPEAFDHLRLTADINTCASANDAPEVIIVEGLMVLYLKELRELSDLKLYIDLDADERALRRLLRDMGGHRVNTDPQFIACFYRECARIGHARYVEPSRVYADLTIRGDANFMHIAPMIATVIMSDYKPFLHL